MPFAAVSAGSLGVAACVVFGNAVGVALYGRRAGTGAGIASASLWGAAGGIVTVIVWFLLAPSGAVAATAAMLVAWAVGSGVALWPLVPRLRAL